MESNLLDMHVVEGYDSNQHYQKIVAVYIDRGELILMTLNPDGLLVKRNAEHCHIKEHVN